MLAWVKLGGIEKQPTDGGEWRRGYSGRAQEERDKACWEKEHAGPESTQKVRAELRKRKKSDCGLGPTRLVSAQNRTSRF